MKTDKIEDTLRCIKLVRVMWKNIKKKVSDFFFEEIEIEENDEDQIKTTPNRNISDQNRVVNAKVKYEYPKKQDAPFRFPVIPDEEIKVNKRRRTTISNRNITVKKRDPLIYGYRTQEQEKELEEVPAFMRRRNDRRTTEHQNEKEEKPIFNHTRPDELDRVFKKRDGFLHSDENIKNENPQSSPVQSQEEVKLENKENVSSNQMIHKELDEKEPIVHQSSFQEFATKTEESSVVEDELSVTMEEQETIQENSYDERLKAKYEATQSVPSYLLNDPFIPTEDDSEWLREQQLLLEKTLKHFKIKANIVNVTQGPAVTRFEVQPALGVKVSKIKNLADDIKLNMAAKDIRIEAPIPGKNTVGIEIPNLYPQVVSLQEIIETDSFENSTSPLTIALGLTIEGEPLITNIDKMPHGLIAGATGSGKSVCINTIILSLLYKSHYENVKLLLIDPKMVELTPYNGIPHLISPVITDVKAATMALKWAVKEMEARYEKFVEAGVRNIVRYNEKILKEKTNGEKLPYIVIIIDELADLMMVSPQDVEDAICRIAQKARACGIHLILATQRPSVDVITGLIKANIPTRIAFSVSSQVDSRTIIDTNGAEKLLGKGDMLFLENGSNKIMRLQGPFVSDEEIDRVASYFRSIAKPNYLFEQEELLIEVDAEEEDELLNDVISFVLEQNQVSTSLLQRRFRIGYNRAARLIDTLEHKGIISAQNGSKPREVLVSKSQINEIG